MRLAIPSAIVATGLVTATFMGLHSQTETVRIEPTTTATVLKHVVPGTYKSWSAQEDALHKACYELKGAQWEDCLVGHYEAKTGYQLMPVEYVANRTKRTFKVTYSKITLPKGGTALKKAQKAVLKVPSSVYCKGYKMSNGTLTLCSNGTSF